MKYNYFNDNLCYEQTTYSIQKTLEQKETLETNIPNQRSNFPKLLNCDLLLGMFFSYLDNLYFVSIQVDFSFPHILLKSFQLVVVCSHCLIFPPTAFKRIIIFVIEKIFIITPDYFITFMFLLIESKQGKENAEAQQPSELERNASTYSLFPTRDSDSEFRLFRLT